MPVPTVFIPDWSNKKATIYFVSSLIIIFLISFSISHNNGFENRLSTEKINTLNKLKDEVKIRKNIGNQILHLISLTNHLWSDFYIKFGPLYNLVSSLHIDCKLVSNECIPLSLKNNGFNHQETKFYWINFEKNKEFNFSICNLSLFCIKNDADWRKNSPPRSYMSVKFEIRSGYLHLQRPNYLIFLTYNLNISNNIPYQYTIFLLENVWIFSKNVYFRKKIIPISPSKSP